MCFRLTKKKKSSVCFFVFFLFRLFVVVFSLHAQSAEFFFFRTRKTEKMTK
jgi:hypothetical protein